MIIFKIKYFPVIIELFVFYIPNIFKVFYCLIAPQLTIYKLGFEKISKRKGNTPHPNPPPPTNFNMPS